MKIIFKILSLSFFSLILNAQSILLEPNKLAGNSDVSIIDNGVPLFNISKTTGRISVGPSVGTYKFNVTSDGELLSSFIRSGSSEEWGTLLFHGGNYLSTNQNFMRFSSNNFNFLTVNKFRIGTYLVSRFEVNSDGNIGIGTATPSTKLEVNGFTKLGSDAPAIKIKKLTTGCTTSANSGFPSGEISLTHGITPSKILKVEALVEYATNFWVKDGNDLSGYEFDIYVTNTTISLRNLSGSASSEIRSKPCKILITYEE